MRYKYVQKKRHGRDFMDTLLVWVSNTDEHWIYTNDWKIVYKRGNKWNFTPEEWNKLSDQYIPFDEHNSHFVAVDERWV